MFRLVQWAIQANFFSWWQQWICTILPWCSHGGSLQRWWTQWVLWRNHFLQDSWWHCCILNPSRIILSSGSGIHKLFSVGVWVHHTTPWQVIIRKKSDNSWGHKPRPGFQLGSGHPLYASHVGVNRMKMCTPMLAEAPPPKFSGNCPIKDESRISKWITDMKYYAKYLIDLCVPWPDESFHPPLKDLPKAFAH